jgi:hypothetical protein
MPKCRNCHKPIIFLPVLNPHESPADKKILPIDVNPDNARGTVVLTNWPFGFGPHVKAPPGTHFVKVALRIYGEAAKMFRSAGGTLYRVHYDSCNK